MVGVGCSAPTISTPSRARPISSSASRSAVSRRSASSGSARPPGNEISPAWRRRSSRRRVRTTWTSPPAATYSGTRTAASVRPWTSSAAASTGSRRTAASRPRSSAREADALHALAEHHLALERPVDRALGRDHAQALDLLGAEVVGEAQDELERRGAAPVGRTVVAGHLDAAEVPALAHGVHLHRDGRAGREARGEQLLGAGPRVVASPVDRLTCGEVVVADLDGLPERPGAA